MVAESWIGNNQGLLVYFEVYRSLPGPSGSRSLEASVVRVEWRWRLRAENHDPIASGESYKNKDDCLKVIELLKSTDNNTPVIEK